MKDQQLQLQYINHSGPYPIWRPAIPDPTNTWRPAIPDPTTTTTALPNPIPPVFAAITDRTNWKGKSRRFYPNNHKKKARARFAPSVHVSAPRNTTSYLIRAKKSGGIAPLVSPCAVTPAVLPTPKISPSTEMLVEMAKEAWGVDGYGSMKGLIRLRPKNNHGDYDEDGSGSGESSGQSDVEEHVEVERRLDQDLSRFEMVLPVRGEHEEEEEGYVERLEEENLTLKGKLFLMETEMGELRRRLLAVETRVPRA